MRAQSMTSDVKVELIEIGHQMNQAGLSKTFIAAAVETAFEFEGVDVRFDDLEGIAKNIRGFKDSLRIKVDSLGGIGELSKKTGIPQPSLSRFFNTASIPHRGTLLKIAKALGLSQVEIATEWSR